MPRPERRLRRSEARDYSSLCDQSGSLVSNRLLQQTRIRRTVDNYSGTSAISLPLIVNSLYDEKLMRREMIKNKIKKNIVGTKLTNVFVKI